MESGKRFDRHRRALSNEVKAESSRRLRAIVPDVRSLRLAVFGSDEAPFPTLQAASTWIEGEAKKQTKKDVDATADVYRRAHKACLELDRITGGQTAPATDDLFLTYRRRGLLPGESGETNAIQRVRFAPDSKLGLIKRTVCAMAAGTGFFEEDLVSFVMVGETEWPVLPESTTQLRSASVSLPSGTKLNRMRMRVEFNVQVPPWPELRKMHTSLSRAVHLTRGGIGLTPFESRLDREVSKRGGPPSRRGAGAAWDSIAKEVGCPTGQAARVAYSRLQKKIADGH